jgi:protein-tyrosine-phosphatase/predicted ATP-grasp superfamily ATP-dependent carboligase
MKRKALVLGYDSLSFLSVIRSLGRAGIEVHVAWHRPDNAAIRSRYIALAHDIPAFRTDDDLWKTRMIELVAREKFDLVIPCHDSSIAPLQQHRADLEPHGRFYLISDEAHGILSDKLKTNELARSLGIHVPREVVLSNLAELEQAITGFDYPVVLKPRGSFNPDDPASRHEVHKVYGQNELRKAFHSLADARPLALQENVLGRGVGVELLMKSGEVLLAFQHVRLHEPPRGGGSSYRMSTALTPELLDASVRLLKSVDYTGVAMVEFKADPKTNRWALMEVNARFWGSLPLAIAAGADFPLALFQMLVENRTDFQKNYRVGVCCRNWEADAEWLIANFRADRTDPTLTTRPITGVIAETVKNIALLRERSDTLTLDDPKPALHELTKLIRGKFSAARRKLSSALIGSRALRRWAQSRLDRRLRSARRILFVCKGNVCRSPFAEAVARERLAGLEVASAGYFPVPGRRSPEHACSAAAAAGFDLSAHRSQVVTEELVRNADVIFVFDQENYEQVTRTYPRIRQRTFLLGTLCPGDSLFIDDPWGLEAETFAACYRHIAKAIACFAEKIPMSETSPVAVRQLSQRL